MISGLPLLACVLLLAIFQRRTAHDLPVAVIDRDHSEISRELVGQLDAAAGLRVMLHPDSLDEAQSAVERGHVYAVIEIPRGFERDVFRGRRPQVGLLLNQQSLSAANTIARDVQEVVLTAAGRQSAVLRMAGGLPMRAAAAAAQPLRVETRPLFNPGIDYGAYLGIALLVGTLHCFVFLHGARTVAAERGDGRRAWSQAARGRPWTALLGKLVPAWLWWFVFGLGILYGAYSWLGLPWMSAPWLLIAGWGVLVAGYLAFGALLSSLLQAHLAYSGVSVLSAPALAFSGVTFPLAAMPLLPRLYGECLPLTWFLRLQTQLVTERIDARFAWPTFAYLLVLAIVLVLAAAFSHALAWRKRASA
nr:MULTISPECIES: ABC transporter permease [unclassified Lysobacter]